ncbi:hypothetical protein [Salinispira pacifica]|uniref:Uncharacterized protein n=1 Tax=Salinispira pacifica TaxID=1307761 RepID=V5WGJ5_9SPIO|nr:hypothetical protein [Salinispira pacifica]AHC14745.1 hypothetical protein L21SP2_1346 [Salinispira pacifica]
MKKAYPFQYITRALRGFIPGRTVLMLLLFIGAHQLPAQALSVPDSSMARRSLIDTITAPYTMISPSDGRILSDPFSSILVKFEVRELEDRLYLIFKHSRENRFPDISAGNMIIRRSRSDGSIDQIKIFLDEIGALVVRIHPRGGRSELSLSLFGTTLYNRIPIFLDVQEIIQTDINRILELAGGRIPWEQLTPPSRPEEYQNLRQMLDDLRTVLPSLPDSEDGAMDARGNMIRIETLGLHALPGFNCSGFAKFVVDGMYFPITDSLSDVELLKIRHPEYRGTELSRKFEESRDPYFGLDWTRNLAVAMDAVARGEDASRLEAIVRRRPEALDVRSTPYIEYRDDLGYPVESLVQVLYLQALENPGDLYLGSINGEFGNDPVLWQHFHVVVLFPYFDDTGRFRVAVLERNVESSPASLQRRYPGNYVHLVRITPSEKYILPEIPGVN